MTSDDRRERLVRAGQWLRDQRQRRFPTAVEFARRLGVDRAVVSNYERGVNAVDDERAEQIAGLLGMDVIEVRRNLGLWVPIDASEAEDGPRLLRPEDVQNLSRNELIDLLIELIEQRQQVQRETDAVIQETIRVIRNTPSKDNGPHDRE